MKICSKCKENKELEEFGKCSQSKDSFNSWCKSCHKAYKNINKEKIKTNREIKHKINPEKRKEEAKRYISKVKEKIVAKTRAWRKRNPEKVKSSGKKWRKANPGVAQAIAAKRNAAKLERTPKWLTEDHFKEIESYYRIAKELEEIKGEKYHVDHIIPLQGKTVSGLHVPWNLRVITAKENLGKSNKL